MPVNCYLSKSTLLLWCISNDHDKDNITINDSTVCRKNKSVQRRILQGNFSSQLAGNKNDVVGVSRIVFSAVGCEEMPFMRSAAVIVIKIRLQYLCLLSQHLRWVYLATIVVIQNVMYLITRWHPCINARHHGIDCRWKYLYFKYEGRKELVSAKNTAFQQHCLLMLNRNHNASIRNQNLADLTFEYP